MMQCPTCPSQMDTQDAAQLGQCHSCWCRRPALDRFRADLVSRTTAMVVA